MWGCCLLALFKSVFHIHLPALPYRYCFSINASLFISLFFELICSNTMIYCVFSHVLCPVSFMMETIYNFIKYDMIVFTSKMSVLLGFQKSICYLQISLSIKVRNITWKSFCRRDQNYRLSLIRCLGKKCY